ncbi:ATP-binding protein [Rhizobium paknamense]|uniref:histidine kinase n=1 Tax=Rhizobium paknamense TaxID=1206817 RepID=A0ABU0IF61_9HYPH|nr:ATP-binding protein [Rhizobium paknamense]MDQ0456883.1 signal transduction histidine kinase/response regulator of citrate/malate metabolism [Rhizobium paknamense]
MILPTRPGFDRRPPQPKTTLILHILSAVLLVTFLLLFKDVSDRFRLLYDDVRENAVWSAYQLDREARTVNHTLADVRRLQSPDAQALSGLSLRYDILVSRNKLMRESRFGDYFRDNRSVADSLNAIDRIISGLQPRFDAMAAGKLPSTADIAFLSDELTTLSQKTEALLIYTNTYVADERSGIRATMIELERTSAIMLALLLLSVIFLVVTLRRQLQAARIAGQRLEVVTRELSDAYEAADAGNRAKSQFMATMGHEIRTPLNAILGMAELLEYSELPRDAMVSVKTIRSSGEALLEVINEILDYSKIEHGKLELEERAVDISGLVEGTVAIMQGRAVDQGNELVLDIPVSLDALYVRTDPTRLRQVLLNLLSNAVKFTRNGFVTLRLREFYRGSALMLRFEVEDTGIGIDEAGLAKLFKPFSQVDASISRKYGGTGLGLTICKQIVEKLGGELGMSSTVGVGSIFWFELPVIAADKGEVRQKRCRSLPDEDFPHLKILVVEDNKVNQQVASRFLEKLGQDVVLANDGSEAVAMTEEQAFDLILMDMQMPIMDGIEATREIIARGGPSALTPIVAMTANASDDDRRRCRAAGMVGFESKPVTMDRLRDVILAFAPAEPAAGDEPHTGQEDIFDMSMAGRGAKPLTLEDHLNELNGLDSARYEELVEALGEDVYQELIESFFNDADMLIGELNRALARGNPQEIDRVLHTIKGAAINVGLSDIAGQAHALRASQPTVTDIHRLHRQIEEMKMKLVA